MAQVKGKKVAIKRRRDRKNIEKGAADIRASFNNTIVTISDLNGERYFSGICRRNGLQAF